MTKEERNAVRSLAAKNGDDLAAGAVKWLAANAGEGNTIELEYKANPEGFAGAVGAIVAECEQFAADDKKKGA